MYYDLTPLLQYCAALAHMLFMDTKYVQYHWYLFANNVKLECLTIVTCNVQPIGRFQGQATDVDIARKEIRNVKIEMVFFHLLYK
jgi:hypothetical protein